MKITSTVKIISISILLIFTTGIKTTPVISAEKKINKTVKKESNKKSTPDPQKAKAEKEKKQKEKDLANDKIAIKKITTTLDYGIQEDRKKAIQLVRLIKDENIRKKALKKVIALIDTDADIEIRKTAASISGDLKAKEAIPALINALNDISKDVQIAASYALKELNAHESKDEMIKLLKKQDLSENSNLTNSLIDALGEFKASEIIKFAERSIKDGETSKMTRESFIFFIGKAGSPAQKDFLISLYTDDEENMEIRSYAVKAIGNLKITEAKDSIKKIIDEINTFNFEKRSNYYSLYINSIATLVKLGDPDSVDLLLNSIRSNNSAVRLKAINLIKDFNDQRTIDILKYKMKNDPSDAVRRVAQKALKEKGIDIEEDEDSKKDK